VGRRSRGGRGRAGAYGVDALLTILIRVVYIGLLLVWSPICLGRCKHFFACRAVRTRTWGASQPGCYDPGALDHALYDWLMYGSRLVRT
jgi:hypothetical protein